MVLELMLLQHLRSAAIGITGIYDQLKGCVLFVKIVLSQYSERDALMQKRQLLAEQTLDADLPARLQYRV